MENKTTLDYVVEVEDLTVAYDAKPVLWDVDLKIPRSRLMAIVGPNGAGKTTTIRMLNGLLQPTRGEILIDERKITDHLVEIRKMIGVLPESHGYYNWMSGREYLTFFAKLYGYDEKGPYVMGPLNESFYFLKQANLNY